MPFFCFSLNSYLDLFVSAVNCGQDKEGRFEVNVEKDLVELTVQSVSKNTKEKLHSFLHRGKPESFFFSNEIFEKLRKSLGVERKTSPQNNLCLKPKKADVISVSIENDLWKAIFWEAITLKLY